jgi:NAD(P)-dependent dehydrogenase (short-subunit alcohol dehydrogenase family)
VPGGIETEIWTNRVRRAAAGRQVDDETRRSELLSSVAPRDISKPSDIANAALFLASDQSRTMTGQSVVVEAGGYMLG